MQKPKRATFAAIEGAEIERKTDAVRNRNRMRRDAPVVEMTPAAEKTISLRASSVGWSRISARPFSCREAAMLDCSSYRVLDDAPETDL